MSDDEVEVREPDAEPDAASEAESEAGPEREPEVDRPDWWHRDHPTFSALSGFFTGLVFVLLVPALFVGILSLFFDDDSSRVEELFPLVLVTLVVPLVLVILAKTRRFGTYMWIGIVSTALVVGGVGAVVLYVLVNGQS